MYMAELKSFPLSSRILLELNCCRILLVRSSAESGLDLSGSVISASHGQLSLIH